MKLNNCLKEIFPKRALESVTKCHNVTNIAIKAINATNWTALKMHADKITRNCSTKSLQMKKPQKNNTSQAVNERFWSRN